MLETAINFLNSSYIPVWGILAFALFISYLENVFPPSPSDTIVILLGSFVGIGKIGFFQLLLFTSIGSTLGFLTMYYLGSGFGHRIVKSKKWTFINEENLVKPRAWFKKYGYFLIVVNRFLSGTRAVISFFAGMSELKVTTTIILATISGIIWNGILIALGMAAGQNWHLVDKTMELYGNIVFIVVAVVVLFFVAKFFYDKRKTKKAE